jgi:hypothetical protein
MATDDTAKLVLDEAVRLDATEMRLLARMPLHAITSVHGEVGLRSLVPTLRELIRHPDTPLDPEVKEMIADQLDDAEARFAAIAD